MVDDDVPKKIKDIQSLYSMPKKSLGVLQIANIAIFCRFLWFISPYLTTIIVSATSLFPHLSLC